MENKNIKIFAVSAILALLIISLLLINLTGYTVKDETIEIGGLFHLTGPGSFWGGGEYNGAMLAIEKINQEGIKGRKINFIVEDSATDFPETVSAINKLVNIDKVDIIIGPTWFAQVASPLAKQNKVLMISPSAGSVPQPNSYFFDVWPTERQEIIPTVDHMKKNKIKDIVVIYSLNEWSQSMRDNFVDEAQIKGLDIIKEFPTNPDEKDFRTIITEIKNLNPDAVYAPFAFFPSQGAFSKQFKELNLDIDLYSSSGTENPALLEAYPEIENTIYPYPEKSEKEQEFKEKYEERFNTPMSPPAAYAYDCVYLIAKALESGADSPEEISDYLREVTYNGVSNTISFDENGRVTQKKHVMKIVRDGKFVKL
ncbi:ABC transporter substrate-binding protein [Candidatus Pacearchaeota archaeon]|nr:ABC transporter substrate-binding protein [Candidatus Pacearchaeota archaeon]MBD3282940.1 ABC transporter substrate-binding protein [Candidatus Pacearchaeota archaeon]